jgi:hypothetical protein
MFARFGTFLAFHFMSMLSLISRFICGSENVEAMSVLMTESHDLELQLTILALFYSALHAGDRYSLKPLYFTSVAVTATYIFLGCARVVDAERVDPALQSFFRSHPDLDQIPPEAFHVLTFLVSVLKTALVPSHSERVC